MAQKREGKAFPKQASNYFKKSRKAYELPSSDNWLC